jgi:hypothetical protein
MHRVNPFFSIVFCVADQRRLMGVTRIVADNIGHLSISKYDQNKRDS